MPSVQDLMTRQPVTVTAATTVAEAATLMGERKVGSALVMEGDALIGIFTERDVLRALGDQFDAAGHPVSEWMTADPVTVTPETEGALALKTMLDGNFRHLPVIEDGRVLGVVSMRDLSGAPQGR